MPLSSLAVIPKYCSYLNQLMGYYCFTGALLRTDILEAWILI